MGLAKHLQQCHFVLLVLVSIRILLCITKYKFGYGVQHTYASDVNEMNLSICNILKMRIRCRLVCFNKSVFMSEMSRNV